MKKIVSGVLVVFMAFALVACSGGKNANDPIVGNWKIKSMVVQDQVLTVEDVAEMGQDISSLSLEIKGNGKMTLTVLDESGNPETGEGTWDVKDGNYKITSEEGDITLKFDQDTDTVTLEMYGAGMVFERA